MFKPEYSLVKVNDYRYNVVVNLTSIPFYAQTMCEIARYEPIDKWYVVKESLNFELSENALKFIYEGVKRLNGEAI